MNEIDFIAEFTRYGLPGLVIAILGFYIYSTDKDRRRERKNIYKEHREEREEWREQSSCQFKKLIEVTNEHTKVIGDLKVILKSIEKDVGRWDSHSSFGQNVQQRRIS